MDNLYEDEIKNSVLHNQELFENDVGKLGQSCILYEKKLNKRVISDVLLCSSTQGVIGIEIKTIHDNLARLPHQLESYSLVCNYVYVLCQDNLIDKVKHLLAELKLYWVGLISYEEFESAPLLGLIKPATLSPRVNTKDSSRLLWRSERANILKYLEGSTYYTRKNLSYHFNRIPTAQAQRLIASLYAYHKTSLSHPLQRYHFHDTYVHDTTGYNVWRNKKKALVYGVLA